jgi:hypothetical protein
MTGETSTGKDLEGSGFDLIDKVLGHLSGGTTEDHEEIQSE